MSSNPMVGPLVSNIDAANANSAAIHIDMQTAAPFTDEDSDSSVEEEDIIPRFVKWRARKGAAATLGDALYGFGSKEDVRVGRMKIDVSTSAKRGWGKGGQPSASASHSTTFYARSRFHSLPPSSSYSSSLSLLHFFHQEHITTMFGGKPSLSVPATLKILRTRAAGTDLGGNMHAQLSLVQASTNGGTAVTPAQFAFALHANVEATPNGAVAEWLLDELEAAEVVQHENPSHLQAWRGVDDHRVEVPIPTHANPAHETPSQAWIGADRSVEVASVEITIPMRSNPAHSIVVEEELASSEPTTTRNPMQRSGEVWWQKFHLSIGARVSHNTRGAGTVALLETDGLQRVHVTFAGGETHRYKQNSWSKLFTAHDSFMIAAAGFV